MLDIHGTQIRAGDTLMINPAHSRNNPHKTEYAQSYKVIKGKKGVLCLEHEDSPLHRYYRPDQWEIVESFKRRAVTQIR